SINRLFPYVNSALRLAIVKHEFWPGHLYKLDSKVKEKPKPKSFEILDNGEFTQHERDASPKDYPSFQALFDPLIVYFQILQYFIVMSGNIPTAIQVYHFLFHNHHLAEMHDGDYSGWKGMDAELTSLYLYGNPK
ncbi:hypothetical protein K439DRAFT_1312530, partial [Ramaria rubella]